MHMQFPFLLQRDVKSTPWLAYALWIAHAFLNADALFPAGAFLNAEALLITHARENADALTIAYVLEITGIYRI